MLVKRMGAYTRKRKERTMKRVLLIMLFIFALCGCVVHYDHPTKKSAAEFKRDKADCERIAEQEYSRKGTRVCDEVDQCLVAKGWRRN